MNKKLLALLLAGLLVASVTACTKPGTGEDTTDSGNTPEDSYIVIGTDENGNDVTEIPNQGNVIIATGARTTSRA